MNPIDIFVVLCFERDDDIVFKFARAFVDVEEAEQYGLDWGGEAEHSPYLWKMKRISITTAIDMVNAINEIVDDYYESGYGF